MPQKQDFLAKTAPRDSSVPSNKSDILNKAKKISVLGLILVFLLSLVLIIFGERFMFDLNRWVNPAIEGQTETRDYRQSYYSKDLSLEKSVLAPNQRVYYSSEDRGEYLGYKLMIHAAFVIPVFLLVFLLYYLVKIKNRKEGWRVAIYAYMVFAFWMLFHLIGEALKYVFYEYENFAIYIVLGLLIVILTPLAIFFQQKNND
jgi:uncharacterized BrkB/YihY/UPF0761 family membrane protein